MEQPRSLFADFVVGKGFRETGKALLRGIKGIPRGVKRLFLAIRTAWQKGWKELDRIVGLLARTLVKYTTPIQRNKVFFFTQEFRYGCNPKYVCEALLRRHADVDVVWRVNDKKKGGFPSTVRTVKAGTYAYYKEIYSANIIVANSYIFLDQALFLKKEQTLIQTWHGSLGIKRFGKDDMKGSPRRRWASVATGKMSSYCITNSRFVSDSLRATYWEKTPMLQFGHPRNDLFFESHRAEREAFRREFCRKKKLLDDCKFVMYAPTFRDSHDFACYDVDFDRLVAALRSRFGGEWCVLLRYHPSLLKLYKKQNDPTKKYKSKILNVTEYVDMQELISLTDVAITDYSSWIYDFMLLRRPGFLFATDVERYDDERGFCYPLASTPFPIARDNAALERQIMTFDQGAYNERLEEFLRDKGCVEDGHASERVVDLILKIIGIEKEENANLEEERFLQEYARAQAAAPRRTFYLKGERKTGGEEILTEKTRFKEKGGVYTKRIFLKGEDRITLFDLMTDKDGTTRHHTALSYDQLTEESRLLFLSSDEDPTLLSPVVSGIYQFRFDADKSELAVTVAPKEAVDNGTLYLEGDFNKDIAWNGVRNKRFRLTEEGGFAVIRDVYMKEGGVFVVASLPTDSKGYEKAFFYNGAYLAPSLYAVHDPATHLIQVTARGIYDISIDLYSGIITLTKKY